MYILKEYIYEHDHLKDVDVTLSEDKESLVRYISSDVGEDLWDWFRIHNDYVSLENNRKYVIEVQ